MFVSAAMSLTEAQELEIAEIKRRKPPYNKVVASSPTRLGMKNSKAHNKAIRQALTGRSLTAEHKAKLWAERDRTAIKGFPHKESTKRLIRQATLAQFKDPDKRLRHKVACEEAALRMKRRKEGAG